MTDVGRRKAHRSGSIHHDGLRPSLERGRRRSFEVALISAGGNCSNHGLLPPRITEIQNACSTGLRWIQVRQGSKEYLVLRALYVECTSDIGGGLDNEEARSSYCGSGERSAGSRGVFVETDTSRW